MRHANLSHAVLKVSPVAHGSVLDVGSVIIYGVDAVMQKFRYLAAVSYAETYECEYANGCIERLVVGRQDVAFGFEQCIKVVHKRREQLQESGVEGGVQLVSLFAGELDGACQLSQFGVLSVLDALYDLLANVFQLVNVDRAQSEEASHIHVLHAVGFRDLRIENGELRIERR